jgi:tetratricopeptide (TPR) repeat protein
MRSMLVELADSPEGVVCSFSSLNGQIEFRRSLSTLPTDRHFFQDQERGWYQRGCTGFESIKDLLSHLERLRSRSESKRLITIGSSMGGFGALLIGNLLAADVVIAFDPQTFIDEKNRAYLGDIRWASDLRKVTPIYPDIAPIINVNTKNYIVFGQDVSIDAVHALRLGDQDTVSTFAVGYSNHNSASQLARTKELDRFLSDVYQGHIQRGGELPEHFDFGRWKDRSDDYLILTLFEHKTKKLDTLEIAEKLVQRRPEWAFAQLEHAKNLLVQRRREEALTTLSKAVTIRPHYAEVRLQIGMLLSALGNQDDAIAHLEQATLLAPQRAAVFYQFGVALDRGGFKEQARSALQKACDLSPDWIAARELLSRVSKFTCRS